MLLWYTERCSLQDNSAQGKIEDFFHGGKRGIGGRNIITQSVIYGEISSGGLGTCHQENLVN